MKHLKTYEGWKENIFGRYGLKNRLRKIFKIYPYKEDKPLTWSDDTNVDDDTYQHVKKALQDTEFDLKYNFSSDTSLPSTMSIVLKDDIHHVVEGFILPITYNEVLKEMETRMFFKSPESLMTEDEYSDLLDAQMHYKKAYKYLKKYADENPYIIEGEKLNLL